MKFSRVLASWDGRGPASSRMRLNHNPPAGVKARRRCGRYEHAQHHHFAAPHLRRHRGALGALPRSFGAPSSMKMRTSFSLQPYDNAVLRPRCSTMISPFAAPRYRRKHDLLRHSPPRWCHPRRLLIRCRFCGTSKVRFVPTTNDKPRQLLGPLCARPRRSLCLMLRSTHGRSFRKWDPAGRNPFAVCANFRQRTIVTQNGAV